MNPIEELTKSTKGLKCTEVTLYAAHSWRFAFEGKFGLNIQCPWRIVDGQGVRLGSEDEGQWFGLPAPVDGSKSAMKLISETCLEKVVVIERTGDIRLEFESGVWLEVFNGSAGYEGWNCGLASGLEVIGLGGGGISSILPPE